MDFLVQSISVSNIKVLKSVAIVVCATYCTYKFILLIQTCTCSFSYMYMYMYNMVIQGC